MSMQAIGTYITTLRLAQGMTQLDLAVAAGTNTTTISRYENGTQKKPEMPLLFRVVAAVKGSGDHLMTLALSKNPTDDYARALAAEAQLTPEEREQIGRFATSDEDTLALLEAAYEASQHNKGLARELLGYIKGAQSRASQLPADTLPAPSRRRRPA